MIPASRSETFVYDQLGNRKGDHNVLDPRGNVTFARRDNGLNQYASWTPPMAAINYDTNGVLTSEGWITGSYNALNQPITISTATTTMSFEYDPLGRCVKRTSGTTVTYLYYDGWNLVQEGLDFGAPDRIYVHGGRIDEIVADQNSSGVWSYHHYDARGHCILLTGSSGTLVEQYSYDAFGKVYFYDGAGYELTDGSAVGNRFLFTGREWISDLKLYDFRNRLYLPELGRFIQPDPKEFAVGDYNLYRYCHNDPVNRDDPFGLDFTAETKLVETLPGTDYGISPAFLTFYAHAEPTGDGYRVIMDRFDVNVSTQVRTTYRNSFDKHDPEKSAIRPDQFNRDPRDINRTVKHEGRHQQYDKNWYDTNRDVASRALSGKYKSLKEANAAISSEKQQRHQSFRDQQTDERNHSTRSWNDYRKPPYEHTH